MREHSYVGEVTAIRKGFWSITAVMTILLVIAIVPTRFGVSGFTDHYRVLHGNINALKSEVVNFINISSDDDQSETADSPEVIEDLSNLTNAETPAGELAPGNELSDGESASLPSPTNVQARAEWTTTALRAFADRGYPILYGVGFDASLNGTFSTTEPVPFIHNDLLEILIRQGLGGTLTVFTFLLFFAFHFYRFSQTRLQFVLGFAYIGSTIVTQVTIYYTYWGLSLLYVAMRFAPRFVPLDDRE